MLCNGLFVSGCKIAKERRKDGQNQNTGGLKTQKKICVSHKINLDLLAQSKKNAYICSVKHRFTRFIKMRLPGRQDLALFFGLFLCRKDFIFARFLSSR